MVSRLGAAHITGLQQATEQEKVCQPQSWHAVNMWLQAERRLPLCFCQAALGVADDRGLTVAACAKHYVGDGGLACHMGGALEAAGYD